jgi:hypothetical protein
MALRANAVYMPGVAATGDLSSNQYYVVKYASTAGEIKVVSATTDEAIGILQDDPEAGQGALVQVDGVAKAVAGTSVGWTANISVGFNTTGKVVPIAYNGTNDNRRIIGKYPFALGQTTTVSLNQVVSVQLLGGVTRA